MYKISLVNMPFANLNLPSIGLTQLRSVVEQRLGAEVRVRVLYLNHEVAQYLGFELYAMMTSSLAANNSGLGDWFFRQIAFPDQADNSQAFFQRYFPLQDETLQARKGQVLAKRAGLERFLLRLAARYQLEREDLVGFTSMFAQNVASFALARLLKERNPKLVTVVGGANCEAPMGQELARHVPQLDYVFSGPSLVSFPELVAHQLAGDHEACQRLRGVFTRDNLGSSHLQGAGAIGAELPIEVPVPLDYEPFLADLARNFPRGEVEPYLTFETSRGCWWGERSHCTFCGLNGSTMAYRAMSSEAALELFRDLFQRYAGRCSRFESVDNIMPREYLREVFPQLETPSGVRLFYEVKADLKAAEMEVLATAGVTEIQPGIESLASSTLKLMGKGTTAFQNLAFLKNCVKYGIRPSWNLLIGFPGEGAEVYAKYLRDLPLLPHLPPPSGAFPVRFDRYSPYFTQAQRYELELSPYDFYRFIYPLEEAALANIAYYFEDKNYNARYLQEVSAWQGKLNAAVAQWHQRWFAGDGRARGQLVLRWQAGEPVVLDSRTGEAAEYPLAEPELAILRFIDLKGWKLRDIARNTGTSEAEVAASLQRLQGLGLIFEENERFMSLVILEDDEAMQLLSFGAEQAVVDQAAGAAA